MSTVQARKPLGKVTPELPTTTSLGRKYWMALSGVLLLFFVIGHMLGNLQVFIGQDQLNTYAEKLQELGLLLWAVRLFLLAFAVVHILFGIVLWIRNRESRPVKYHDQNFQRATLASRTMIWSGAGIGLYVVYHLLHFTFRVTNPGYQELIDPLGRPDVYSMVVLGFQNYFISGIYILAMLFLAFHLSHGAASMFQSMGWNTTRVEPILKRIAFAVAVLLFAGYTAVPVAVLLGIVTLPGGGY